MALELFKNSFSFLSAVNWFPIRSLFRDKKNRIHELPQDLQVHILTFLKESDFAPVCKSWNLGRGRVRAIVEISEIRAGFFVPNRAISLFFASSDFQHVFDRRETLVRFAGMDRPLRKEADFEELLDRQLIKGMEIIRRQVPAEIPLFLATQPKERAETIRQYLASKPAWMQEIVKLDLKQKTLTVFIPEIALFENLEELDLEGNWIRVLPSEMMELKKLKNLNLSNNELAELPSGFPEFSRQVKVNLAGNPIDPSKGSAL